MFLLVIIVIQYLSVHDRVIVARMKELSQLEHYKWSF